MIKRLTRLIRSDTAKDASTMTIGTAVAALLAAVFFIIAARRLGPKEFGIFSLATAASFMFADMVDLALNAALVRFVAAERNKEEGKAEKYMKYILKIKLGIGMLLMVIVALFAPILSKLLFGSPLPTILFLTGLGTAFQLLYTFGIAHLQAIQRFAKAAFLTALLPGLRLVGLLLLLFFSSMTTTPTLVIYFSATAILIAVSMVVIPRGYLFVRGEGEIAKPFLKYTLPLSAGFAIAAVSGRIDNFILANLSGSTAVGFYAAAFRLFTPFQFLAGSLSTVFAPRFAGFTNLSEARSYFRKGILAICLMSFGLLIFLPFSPFIINLFYGSDYVQSVSVLRILFFGFALFLLQVPFTSTILFYLAKTRVFALISGVQLILIVVGNFALIPRFQENGSAMAFLATQLMVLVMLAIYTLLQLREEKT
ncbi:MAG: hypothetical protein A3A65_03055 [Candidatus Chisholmbacteria bacterium RIFCSPLOWO2_01_FULL_49_14]|uniref:Polysaccharide biosynthesis protein C-terminal domain-containing protein n=1 Tax=Candidatus Chisholmbacteria bacterium RIFCSPLOWO2_01_FULL_49_14 TaxID=1797593 RepID=A0A1G1W2V5_9BACT|nr:MAG: hypothetical protein A3A65_03055 [Candidatus Chisholmbacteria bacterium RIFCSPLOWO2_01_FULL_49_14]